MNSDPSPSIEERRFEAAFWVILFAIFFTLFLVFRAIFDAFGISHLTLAIVLIVVVLPVAVALTGLYCKYVCPDLAKDAVSGTKRRRTNEHLKAPDTAD
jgi:hypothetical protein